MEAKRKTHFDYEEELLLWERRFENLIELSSEWYWEQDEHFRYTLLTGSAAGHGGIDPRRFIGTYRWDRGATPLGDGGSWDEHKAVLKARQPFTDFLYKRPDAKIGARYISTSGQPLFDEKGRFRGYFGVGKDISRSWRDEQLLTLEHTITRCLADAESTSSALQAAMRALCEAEGWECARYFRPDHKAGVLRFAESWGVNEPAIQEFIERSRDLVYQPGSGLMGRVWESGQPLWVADVTKDSRAQRAGFTVDLGIHGGFVFPVKSEGKTIGVLAFNTREIRQADERLLKAIQVIGSQMGQFLERKRAEEEQRRFRAAMDASADFMLLVDPVNLRYVDVNDAACRALGYSREELLQMGPADIFSVSREELARSYKQMIAGDLVARGVKGRYRRKDGSVLEVEAYPRAVKTSEGHVIVSIARDITERLATEETLRRFRLAMDNSADMIVLIDRSTMRFIDMNNTACSMLGYTREELLQMGPQDVLPTTREELERIYDEFIANPTHTHGMQSSYRRKDGTTFAFESTRHVMRSGDTHIIAAISRDTTPRIEAEEALRSSEERFRSLTNLSSDIYWEQDEQFRFTKMSGSGSGRVNTKTFRTIGKRRWEQNYINMTPEKWAEHIALLEAHKEFRDMELCRLDESGNKIWISISGEPVFDSAGAFKGYRGVGKDISERKFDEEHIHYLANHDALTALPNRAMFSDVLTMAIQNGRRYNRGFAVLFIDLDRFKNINDTLGHDAGDKLLQEMGQRLVQTVRTSDVVARLGGDEFVVLIHEVTEAKQVSAVARKVLSALVQPMTIQGQECRLTASIGICMYPSEAQDEVTLMKGADIAMYRAKEDGKNNYKFYSQEMNVHSFERLALETSLRRGIERNEFLLHYQAKLDLRNGRITGVEALVRWQHPDMGMVPPAQFIPLAEETGLIVPLGKWVLHTACAQGVAWQKQGLPPVHIAVNLSARQFADDDLVADIAEALRVTGLPPQLLELELTESMVIQNSERAGRVLKEIKAMGVRLAIDDFGVGYSSLTHLKRFPIDTLKVDRSFIRDVPGDAEDKAITEAIIAMGKSLNLTVVAEGVETQEQQTFLREHACDEMQGFFFSKPIPGEAFAELLRQRTQALQK
jgi:diguanylate cyclase (GGDEF)-like protein/PAS domain S-box-containing protein